MVKSKNKSLILMRHVESPHSLLYTDINREISARGINQAQEASNFLTSINIDKILVSPANRTISTMNIILQNKQVNNIEIKEEIYNDSKEEILNIINQQHSDINDLMIIGHNPHINNLALQLAKNNDKKYETLMLNLISPGSIIILIFSDIESWEEVGQNKFGNIKDIFIPL